MGKHRKLRDTGVARRLSTGRIALVLELPPAPSASSEATRTVMRANKGRDTSPELRLQSELHARGLRFLKHRAPVPGLRCQADVLFPHARVAVFVDGCFWHGCPEHGHVPGTNRDYWRVKFLRNIQRDRRNNKLLTEAGWTVVRAWEHQEPVEVADQVQGVVQARSEPR